MMNNLRHMLLDLFLSLDRPLAQAEALWRPKPWEEPRVAWRSSHPRLHADLLRLSTTELARLQADEDALHDWVRERMPSFGALADATRELHQLAASSWKAPTHKQDGYKGISTKKWAQVRSFAAAVPRSERLAIEWCSGKGYLSHRLLADRVVSSATCLEIDSSLCAAGRSLATRYSLPITFVQADVLSSTPIPPLVASAAPDAAHFALHACGGLHRRMVRSAVALGSPLLAVAPCCYHKHPQDGSPDKAGRTDWTPLSSAGRDSRLRLNHSDLRLAASGECARRRRDGRLREREMIWRQAFRVWQRRAYARRRTAGGEGIDWAQASRLPSIPLPLLSQGSSSQTTAEGFKAFCAWGSTVEGESLPERARTLESLDCWSECEAELCLKLGRSQASRIARLELLRHAFRRPLELWLILDMCLFLDDSGYDVCLKKLCERSISHRNMLLVAERTPRSSACEG
ncbi:MAG: hypothetical protein SGPRY_001096 [Prymnesium sp.]